MIIFALDPGPTKSALLVYESETRTIVSREHLDNREVLLRFPNFNNIIRRDAVLVVEQVESYGMAVGAEVFDTVFWSGRFVQAWPGPWHRMPRRAVKLHLCRDSRAKDTNIRQALIDRFGPGKDRAIGRKSSPGPLFGVSSHSWSALALAVTFADSVSQAGR